MIGAVKLWEHTRDELVLLPLDDRALLVLADFVEGGGWNWRNWIVEAEQHQPLYRQTGVPEVLAESWGLLNVAGACGSRPSPEQRHRGLGHDPRGPRRSLLAWNSSAPPSDSRSIFTPGAWP